MKLFLTDFQGEELCLPPFRSLGNVGEADRETAEQICEDASRRLHKNPYPKSEPVVLSKCKFIQHIRYPNERKITFMGERKKGRLLDLCKGCISAHTK